MRTLPTLAALTLVTALACTACSSGSDDASGTATSGGTTAATFDPSTIKKDDTIAALVPKKIADAGKLVVGSNTEYAPAEFIGEDGKTPVGYDIDLIKAVGAVMGLKVEIQSADFTAIIPALGSKYDAGISSFTITNERMQSTNMISVFNAGEAFGVAKGNPKKIDPADLCGHTITVETGTVEDEGSDELNAKCKADGKKPIEVLRYDSQADATTNLVGGKADVMYADSPVIAYAIEQTGGQVEELGSVFDSAPQGIVVAKADTALAEAVQKAVQKLMDDGNYVKVLKAWGNDEGALDKSEVNPAQPE